MYTASGAVLSVVTVSIILYLVVTEAYFNFQVTLEEKVHVNATSPDGLELEFDITLPNVPCKFLNVDANDPTGQSQSLHLDRQHHVWKHRMKVEDGVTKLIGEKSKLELGSTLRSEEDLVAYAETLEGGTRDSKGTDNNKPTCGSCYGAGEEGECCDTCDDVQRAYRRKGWVLKDMESVEQCKGSQVDMEGEGCNVHGVVALSTGGGNLHLAPGTGHSDVSSSGTTTTNILDFILQSMSQWNVSHTLHKVRFGPYYPAATYQLDQQTRNIKDTYGMYQYYFQVRMEYF